MKDKIKELQAVYDLYDKDYKTTKSKKLKADLKKELMKIENLIHELDDKSRFKTKVKFENGKRTKDN